jgi:hypothetical protein
MSINVQGKIIHPIIQQSTILLSSPNTISSFSHFQHMFCEKNRFVISQEKERKLNEKQQQTI